MFPEPLAVSIPPLPLAAVPSPPAAALPPPPVPPSEASGNSFLHGAGRCAEHAVHQLAESCTGQAALLRGNNSRPAMWMAHAAGTLGRMQHCCPHSSRMHDSLEFRHNLCKPRPLLRLLCPASLQECDVSRQPSEVPVAPWQLRGGRDLQPPAFYYVLGHLPGARWGAVSLGWALTRELVAAKASSHIREQ